MGCSAYFSATPSSSPIRGTRWSTTFRWRSRLPRDDDSIKNAPALGRGRTPRVERDSQTIENLVRPEPLKPVQRFVERRELVGVDPADLLHGTHMLLIERVDNVAHLAAFLGQLDTNRAAIDARALVVEKPHLDQLLEVVGDVRAEIIAARAQLSGCELLVSDIVKQQRLNRVDVGTAAAIELVLDHIEQPAVQPLD